jgi:hypothetical protein
MLAVDLAETDSRMPALQQGQLDVIDEEPFPYFGASRTSCRNPVVGDLCLDLSGRGDEHSRLHRHDTRDRFLARDRLRTNGPHVSIAAATATMNHRTTVKALEA